MWRAAEPVVKEWLTKEIGPAAKLKKMQDGLKAIDHFMDNLPNHLANLEEDLDGLAGLARTLKSMDQETLETLLKGRAKPSLSHQLSIWLIAATLIIIAVFLYFKTI
jgi:ubiquinone biosynthesis protein